MSVRGGMPVDAPVHGPENPAALLIEVSGEALYLVSLDGRICYWSAAAESLFGFSAEQATAENAVNLLTDPEHREAARATLAEGAETGYAFAELTRRTRTEQTLTTRVSVRRMAESQDGGPWLAIAEQDLTAMRRTEEQLFAELRASEDAQALFQSVLDSARDIAIVAVQADGRISLWSAGAERLFACRRADICGPEGRSLLARLTGPDTLPLAEAFERAMDQGSYVGDFDARTRGQRPFPASITARPRYNRFGEPEGVIAVIQDLTERVETLRELDDALDDARRAREAALAAARTKAEFLANMSHEIRTPMNAVLGMLQLLMRSELSNKQADYARKAEGAASDLLHIIDDILDFSKIEAGKLALNAEPFGIDQLLKDIGVILGANVGDKLVEVLFQVDPDLPKALVGDSHRLKQILINLCGNALKFTERGEVVLSVTRAVDDNAREFVRFSVRDTGIGMTPSQQQRLFKAFSQAEAGTTRRFGGTGLGLVICQRLVKLMGGEMGLESEPGVGSTFSFAVPLPEAGNEVELPSRRMRPPELLDLRVLIVDDNELAREIISELARSLGWRVDVAASGAEALELVGACLRRGHSYDIAFVDWAMPGMDGWETIRAMRGLAAPLGLPTSVIMVTAHTREAMEDQRSNESDLIGDFLVKPVTASDLFDAVSNTLGTAEGPSFITQASELRRLEGLKILVVEDNLNNQQIALELLEYEGAQVDLADGGVQAIEALRSDSKGYDVVLMDIQMPDMDGYTATRRIRSELGLKSLPIIAMTANVMPADREAAQAAGMDGHIGKPYHVETVIETVLQHCGREVGAAPPAAHGALPPSPPGFDFASALNRLGGNQMLYAKQAHAFAVRARTDLARTREFMAQGDLPSATRELHTLRGLAGTLGALSFASELRVLEDRVKTGETPDSLDQDFERLNVMAAEAGNALSALSATLEAGFQPAPTGKPTASDDTRCAQVLAELETLVEQSNMRAVECYAELLSAGTALDGVLLRSVGDALDSLDFPAALAPLRKLKESLQ